MTRERKWQIDRELLAAGYTRQQVNEEFYFILYLRGSTSPDGLRWQFPQEPTLEFGRWGLDSQNSSACDPEAQRVRGLSP